MGKPEPAPPEPPPGGEMVWGLWLEISEGRTSSGFGEQPIGWPDIAAWSMLSGYAPDPGECRLILALDRHYLSALADEREKQKPKK